MLAFVATLLWRFADSERARLEDEAVNAARSIAVAVDRELAGITAALDVLALSRNLRTADLEAFHGEAVSLRGRLGVNVTVQDGAGRQILNARLPHGTELPSDGLPEVGRVLRQHGAPVISDLFVGSLSQEPQFAVQMAVPLGDGEPRAVLGVSLPVERMRATISQQSVPPGWTVAIVDREGRILARNMRHEEFVGRPATRDLQAATGGEGGSWNGFTADGRPVLGAYARSTLSRWRIAVGVPRALLTEPLRRSLWLLAGAGAALLGLSAVLAVGFGRRIARPMQGLVQRATALGRGEMPPPLPRGLREAALVDAALTTAARSLRAREDELRRLNEALESRVAERTRELAEANARLRAEAAERERTEAQLRQSQKMEAIGRLTGGVAHDFNNLLTVVIGNLSIAQRRLGEGGDSRLLRALTGATEGATRAATLTQRLLAFSRQQPLQPEAVDANRLVAGMSELLRRTLGEDVEVETVLAGGLWRALADPNQLEAALLNLAVNARDAMPSGGKLTIETANAHLDEAYCATREEVQPGQYVMLSVSDTGMGMPPDVLVRAFEPFFTTKPVGKGTGLGLSQVYGFARQSGGHAAIYSEAGQGTTVKLYLPRLRDGVLEPPAVQRAAESRPADPPTELKGECVLVVEDDASVREFAVTALEDAGYRVLAAEDGPSGLALLDANPQVRLLFTDVVLTGPMNGRELAEVALARRPQLKVLYTTGYTSNAIIHHGRLDEGVNFLGKPYTISALTECMRRVLTG